MDFTYYPNINNIANELGGIKQSKFNKKEFARAEESWAHLTPDEISRIDQEAQYATKIMSSYVMPSAIIYMDSRALVVVPVKDIVWVYGHVTTTRVNLIPTSKNHAVMLLTRYGKGHVLGSVNTIAFSRKKPCDDAIAQIRQIIFPYRKGIIYGYSDDIQKFFKGNFAAAVREVDARSI